MAGIMGVSTDANMSNIPASDDQPAIFLDPSLEISLADESNEPNVVIIHPDVGTLT